jgi:hypothetical protein
VSGKDGKALIERTFTIPCKEGATSKLASERPPTEMMRDRVELGNRTEVGYIPIGMADQASAEDQKAKKAALSELAKNVKLKKDAEGKVVLNQENLSPCRTALRHENYEKLDTEPPRLTAMAFDEIECIVTALISDLTRLYGKRVPVAELDRYQRRFVTGLQLLGTVYAELAAVQTRVERAGLCRCPDGRWWFKYAQLHSDCGVPQLPE